MKIKYDLSIIGFMSLFEKVTHSKLKDCFIDKRLDMITFIVQPGQLGIALGKKAANVKELEKKLKKRVRIIEFNPDKLKFIRNMVMPLDVKSVTENEDGIVIIEGADKKTKGLLIGRNAQNLRNLEENVRRFFDVKEIKVV
ncbi:MAG: NusA-like transcription termination signal-binding factor [Candidatus Woesearchaeota archaeon]|nr:NusA-like transcription termination signal-binding factor [Candidatus Woesearchaeota archaeon]